VTRLFIASVTWRQTSDETKSKWRPPGLNTKARGYRNLRPEATCLVIPVCFSVAKSIISTNHKCFLSCRKIFLSILNERYQKSVRSRSGRGCTGSVDLHWKCLAHRMFAYLVFGVVAPPPPTHTHFCLGWGGGGLFKIFSRKLSSFHGFSRLQCKLS
jgi:hypothetical protein